MPTHHSGRHSLRAPGRHSLRAPGRHSLRDPGRHFLRAEKTFSSRTHNPQKMDGLHHFLNLRKKENETETKIWREHSFERRRSSYLSSRPAGLEECLGRRCTMISRADANDVVCTMQAKCRGQARSKWWTILGTGSGWVCGGDQDEGEARWVG